jgi:GT2 family glycosyltransferase
MGKDNSIKMPHVSAIVVFHNGKEQTLRCLNSIKKQGYRNYDVTVVDDGSTDDSSVTIAAQFPDVRIIRGDGNLWCNGSFNVAIEKCLAEGAKLLLLLNNDNIISPEALSYLVDTHESNNVHIVGSLVCYFHQPDTVSYAGKLINWQKGQNVLIHHGKKIVNVPREVINVDFLGFQGVLISKDVFDRIGLVDARTFKHYSGDTDFYLRARKAGFKVVVDSRAVVWDDIDSKGGTGIKPSLGAFIKELRNIKSLSHVPTRYRFYRRHAPQFWAIAFGKYYLRLIKGQIYAMAKYRLSQLEGDHGPIKNWLLRLFK